MLNPEIVKAVAVAAELTGANLSELAMEAMVEYLSGHEPGAVLKALHRCQIELRTALTLGAVMDRLDDGHPGPEIAWALVAKLGEADSVVWTDQIARAFGVVRGLLDDRVAARLAFLEAYRTQLAEARARHVRPVWWPSLGYDVGGRLAAITEAVALGRLTERQAMRILPEHCPVTPVAMTEGKAAAKQLVDGLTRRLATDARAGA